MRNWLLAVLAVFVGFGCDDSSPCTPACGTAVCGEDGCGGTCGNCADGRACSDGQCVVETCGNGQLDENESCDDSSASVCDPPSYCESTNACVLAVYSGDAASCDARCETTLIQTCVDDDGCCPVACNPTQDNDCRPQTCGNGQLDDRETCDPPEFPCVTTCPNDDPCLTVRLTGLVEACNAACTTVPITACYEMPDGCCPQDCATDEDADCASAACGNGVRDAGEACDPAIAWPARGSCTPDCDDNRACTQDSLAGDAQSCSTQCSHVAITQCQSGDGCCPAGCSTGQDSDCSAVMCGDGVVDGDEACDSGIAAGYPGSCPGSVAACDDLDACTTDTFTGQASDCSAACENTPPPCGAEDSCCPSGCAASNDPQCAALNLCDVYCTNADAYCNDGLGLYVDEATCRAACADFPTGEDGAATGDSLHCRMHHLFEAMSDPATHCPHAGQSPTEACVD